MNRKALLAAGLLMCAAAMTGCMADTRPAAAPTPQAEQKATAKPTEKPAEDSAAETAPLRLLVAGREAAAGAVMEGGMLLLPLEETAELLGWKADSTQTQEETAVRRVVALEKDDSRITVSWTVSDNTAKNITWQKDGLLIPVDTMITTIEEHVYVPAAFFEEAMDISVSASENEVSAEPSAPAPTPPAASGEIGENG